MDLISTYSMAIPMTTTQSHLTSTIAYLLWETYLAHSLPLIGQLSMNHLSIPSQPHVSGLAFTHKKSSITATRASHMLKKSYLIGHTIPSSSHIPSSATTLGSMFGGMPLLACSEVSKPLAVT